MMLIEEAGHTVLWSVHDEAVCAINSEHEASSEEDLPPNQEAALSKTDPDGDSKRNTQAVIQTTLDEYFNHGTSIGVSVNGHHTFDDFCQKNMAPLSPATPSTISTDSHDDKKAIRKR
jgi:hypothetical protein